MKLVLSALFALVMVMGITAFADHLEVTIVPVAALAHQVVKIRQRDVAFPSTATVDVGGKVIMTNTDSAAHTFTSGTPDEGPDGVFDTSLLMVDNSYEWTPMTVGEQPYFCMAYPWMIGKIIVGKGDARTPDPISLQHQTMMMN